ncbi:6482_t:CDS:2 [Entrophospora sp. SA101]|nr:6482_t:CDS:2 [Entrophospora sp. SA101]
MGNNYYSSSNVLNGSIAIATFLGNDTSNDDLSTTINCVMKPLSNKTDILLIPFKEGFRCPSFADIIKSNNWMTTSDNDNETNTYSSSIADPDDFTTKTFTPTSRRKDFFLDNKRLGDWNVLFNSIPLLSLISENDANRVSNLLSNISSSSFSVDFTLDTGPWNGLIESCGLLISRIIFGIVYVLIILASVYMLFSGINKQIDQIKNPRPWLLGGVALMFLIMVEYDPWAIYLDRLSETAYESIVGAGYLLLCLCYAGFLFPWMKATKNLSEEFNYKVFRIRSLMKIFIYGVFFAALIKIVSFIIYLLLFAIISDDNVGSDMKIVGILELIFLVLECVFGAIVSLAFGIFGFCMSSAINYNGNSSLQRRIRNSRKRMNFQAYLFKEKIKVNKSLSTLGK